MPPNLAIRPFQAGDEDALRAVFTSAIHSSASRDYSPAQCAAWAPDVYDREAWASRLQRNRPFVVTVDGVPVAFADLQADGYIDQFFVDAHHGSRGIGRALLDTISAEARSLGLTSLYSNVSLTAEPLFTKAGFIVEERQRVELGGEAFVNSRMRCRLQY